MNIKFWILLFLYFGNCSSVGFEPGTSKWLTPRRTFHSITVQIILINCFFVPSKGWSSVCTHDMPQDAFAIFLTFNLSFSIHLFVQIHLKTCLRIWFCYVSLFLIICSLVGIFVSFGTVLYLCSWLSVHFLSIFLTCPPAAVFLFLNF